METNPKSIISPPEFIEPSQAVASELVPVEEHLPAKCHGESEAKALADCYTSSAFQAAGTITDLSRGGIDVDALMAVLQERALAVKAGDLSGITDVLMGQIAVLSELMNVFTTRCAGAIYQPSGHDRMQQYADLSLRANGALVKTIKALADINSPKRTAVFIAQQNNNAAGHMQINNGDRQENPKNAGGPENELLRGIGNGQTLD